MPDASDILNLPNLDFGWMQGGLGWIEGAMNKLTHLGETDVMGYITIGFAVLVILGSIGAMMAMKRSEA